MLKQNSLSAGYSTAEQLAANSLMLQAIDDTPLAALIQACVPVENYGLTIKTNGDFEAPDSSIVANSQVKDLAGNVPHDMCMDEYTKLISKAVSLNLDYAKNRVNPMIKEVVDSASEYADGLAQGSLSPMNVTPYYYPDVFNNPILAEMVSKYADVAVNNVQLSMILPKFDVDALKAMALTGIGRMDDDVKTFLDGLTDEQIEKTYLNVFGSGSGVDQGKLLDRLSPRPRSAWSCLLVFLLANRLYSDIPSGVNADLGTYRAYIASIMSQAGRAVASSMRQRGDNFKSNFLVLDKPYLMGEGNIPEGDVIVNGDVYDKWLKEGGSPETLFGAATNGGSMAYPDLLARKEQYTADWKRKYDLMRTTAQFNRFNYFLDGMRKAVLNQIAMLDPGLRNTSDNVYKARLTEHLKKVKDSGVGDPWHVARKLVCRVFFPAMNVEMILCAIDAQEKANPMMEPREAALLATIEIVAKWIASLFTVEYVVAMKRN
jgi:hypothetical protein